MDTRLLGSIKEVINKEFDGDYNNFINFIREHFSKVQPISNFKGTEVLVKVRNVSKSYKLKAETINALKIVNLDIYEGEIVSIMGPSGSGKSTLLQIIGGLDQPTEGTVEVSGQTISSLKDKELSNFRNKTAGFIFQLFYLQPYLDVLNNVMLPLIISEQDRKIAEAKATEIIKAVGLESRINHLPKQLSGGQMQRVAIARALANNPKMLLADEPTANLDAQTSTEILSLLHDLRDRFKTTIVLVTHDNSVSQKSDRVINLLDGEIL